MVSGVSPGKGEGRETGPGLGTERLLGRRWNVSQASNDDSALKINQKEAHSSTQS